MVPPTETGSCAADAQVEMPTWASVRIRRPVLWEADREGERQVLPLSRRAIDRTCRVLNILAAVLLMVISLPLMVAIAVAVRLSSPGPVIFRQPRVGLDRRDSGTRVSRDRRSRDHGGRLFDIYKFRTMYIAEGEAEEQVWATLDDARVTPLGRMLRSFRLDELPQLWNVIRGDMNLVGPRPEQPEIFAELRHELDRYSVRQRVLPGITGLAQVNQGYDETVEDVKSKLGYDLQYIRNRSPLSDLRIMARTAPVMILRKGAK